MDAVGAALSWGVDLIQIREKDLDERSLFEVSCEIVRLAAGSGCRVLVNGRADVAWAAGADGVHLPSTGLQVRDVRSWLPDDFIIGVSVHTLAEVRRAHEQGAAYALMGHVFPTASKAAYGKPVGLDLLTRACSLTSMPVLALGGIGPERIDAVLATGAAGVAGITLFQSGVLNSFPRSRWSAS